MTITSKRRQLLILLTFVIILYVGCYGISAIKATKVRSLSRSASNVNSQAVWAYRCHSETCVRVRASAKHDFISLESCQLLCSTPQIWPRPTTMNFTSRNSSVISTGGIYTVMNAPEAVKKLIAKALVIFRNNLTSKPVRTSSDVTNLKIIFDVKSHETKLKTDTEESYTLRVKLSKEGVEAQVISSTYFGARHALETLSQLIWYENSDETLNIIHDVTIVDKPSFPHRGLMIDTSRNYFPIKMLLKVIDGMAATKLNVLHLHLTDAVSFPVVLPSYPNFAKYGAYSKDMIYTAVEISDLIKYAHIRGIRTILEIDAPTHVNEGWNYADTDTKKLVICGEDDVLNGHLNPDNDDVFDVLENIYKDLLSLGSDSETFHIGNDEVNATCFQTTKKGKQVTDPDEVWVDFTNKIFETVKTANGNKIPKNIIIWSSRLTDTYLEKLKHSNNLVVQYWFGQLDVILSSGLKVIFSTVGQWYLDCGFGAWKPGMPRGTCDPFTPWQTFYQYRPWEAYSYKMKQILGGEACLWTEMVDVDTFETRIWPRTAAFAERLWSDPVKFDEEDVYSRLAKFKDKLSARGIKTAGMWPQYCSQNPGKCKQLNNDNFQDVI